MTMALSEGTRFRSLTRMSKAPMRGPSFKKPSGKFGLIERVKLLRVYNPPVTIGGPHSVKARAILGCRDIVDTGQPIQNRSVVFGDDSGGCNAMCAIGVMHPIREFQQVSSVLVASKDREAGHCLIAKHLECGFGPVRLAVSANHVASKIHRAGAGEAATRQLCFGLFSVVRE